MRHRWLRTNLTTVSSHVDENGQDREISKPLLFLRGLRDDGRLFCTHNYADRIDEFCLRVCMDIYLDDYFGLLGPLPLRAFEGLDGWVEEPLRNES